MKRYIYALSALLLLAALAACYTRLGWGEVFFAGQSGSRPAQTPAPTIRPTPETQPETVYELLVEDCTWEQAKRSCEEQGGHLAVIRSEEDLRAVAAFAESAGVRFIWLGAFLGENGAWNWVTGEQTSYFPWDAGEPSGTDTDGTVENCLMLWKNARGEWRFNDIRNDPVGYIPGVFGGKVAYVLEMPAQ